MLKILKTILIGLSFTGLLVSLLVLYTPFGNQSINLPSHLLGFYIITFSVIFYIVGRILGIIIKSKQK